MSYFAVFVLAIGCVAAGVTAAVVHTWSLRALSFSHETRLAVLEGTLSREVKARAGQERWRSRPTKDEETLKAMTDLAAVSVPVRKPNWWETKLPRSVSK